jgi:hypothetical protein
MGLLGASGGKAPQVNMVTGKSGEQQLKGELTDIPHILISLVFIWLVGRAARMLMSFAT